MILLIQQKIQNEINEIQAKYRIKLKKTFLMNWIEENNKFKRYSLMLIIN